MAKMTGPSDEWQGPPAREDTGVPAKREPLGLKALHHKIAHSNKGLIPKEVRRRLWGLMTKTEYMVYIATLFAKRGQVAEMFGIEPEMVSAVRAKAIRRVPELRAVEDQLLEIKLRHTQLGAVDALEDKIDGMDGKDLAKAVANLADARAKIPKEQAEQGEAEDEVVEILVQLKAKSKRAMQKMLGSGDGGPVIDVSEDEDDD